MTDTTRTPAQRPTEPLAFDDRTRRVLELKRRIREGTYRPEARHIARAILSHWFALGLELERDQARPPVETPRERREVALRFVVARSEAEVGADGKPLTA
jgi:hypothetical protein